ncbi:hypothetical protein BGX38DRAFT_1281348 [Terfezia claveryi]|nr:hypothetical protein BGX38DRAFT_1281348 [Terfezia claveryi]
MVKVLAEGFQIMMRMRMTLVKILIGDDLGRIQQLYGDFQPIKHDDIDDPANDSDAEPIQNPPIPPDAKAYKTDQIRQLPAAGYQAGQYSEIFHSRRNDHGYNHLHPSIMPDFKLARFFTFSKVPLTKIDFFQENILPGSPADPRRLVSPLNRGTHSPDKPTKWLPILGATGSVQYAEHPKADFYYRNIIDCIKYLLRQRAFVKHMLWEPVKLFNSDNERIYSELNTGSWWWDQQKQVPVGCTVVRSFWRRIKPISPTSLGTRSYAAVYEYWNIKSTIRNKRP